MLVGGLQTQWWKIELSDATGTQWQNSLSNIQHKQPKKLQILKEAVLNEVVSCHSHGVHVFHSLCFWGSPIAPPPSSSGCGTQICIWQGLGAAVRSSFAFGTSCPVQAFNFQHATARSVATSIHARGSLTWRSHAICKVVLHPCPPARRLDSTAFTITFRLVNENSSGTTW